MRMEFYGESSSAANQPEHNLVGIDDAWPISMSTFGIVSETGRSRQRGAGRSRREGTYNMRVFRYDYSMAESFSLKKCQ